MVASGTASMAGKFRKLCIYWHTDKPVAGMASWTVGELEAEYMRWHNIIRSNEPDSPIPPEFDRILLKQCFQRVGAVLLFMKWLHFFAAPGALLAVDVPYGSHDSASEDLLSQRLVFKDTFRWFEPDWKFRRRIFYLDGSFFNPSIEEHQIGLAVANLRNVVKSFAVELICQKPVPEGYETTDPVSAFKFI